MRLADIPPTTKDELRDRLDDVFSDRRVTCDGLAEFTSNEHNLGRWFLGKYAVSHTSGSQGSPLWVVQDRHCLEVLFGIMAARASSSRQPGILEGLTRLISPRRIAIVTFRRGFYPSGASLEFLPQVLGPFVKVLRLSSMQEDLVAQLRAFRPHVISSYASVLESLVEHREELDTGCLQQFTNSSEQLVDRARRRIESAFGVPVIDHYGAGECLWMADECGATHGGLHLNEDWTIVEVVDDRNEPVPVGSPGAKVLVTNLANQVQPFLRYEIGDRLTLRKAPCVCGCPLPRIDIIDGRSADCLWFERGDERRFVSGVLFHSATDSCSAIREWQVRQISAGQVVVCLELRSDRNDSWSLLIDRLRRKMIEDGFPIWVELSFERVDRIRPDSRTGKMKRMLPCATPSDIASPSAL